MVSLKPAYSADLASAPDAVREFKLPNGLKVILRVDHSFPVVSTLAWYQVGARNERIGNTGITHLLEHMLFGNVGTFRRGEIGSSIARVGGQFNGYTSDDFTTFFETLPSQRLELALRIESERMRGANFTDADVQEELVNVQREFENDAKDPLAALSQEVRSMLYVQHPYHNPTRGWRTDVEQLTAAQLKAYYDKYFWPDNCTLVLCGDFDAVNAQALIEKYFGGISKAPNPVPQLKLAQEPQRGERRTTIKYPGNKEILEMAFHGPALEDPDAPAMVVLEKLLNAPMSGRLKTKLVDTKVCAAATCAFEAKKDPGFITLTCTALPATFSAQQKIIEAVDAMLAQLRSQTVSDAELRRARNQAEFSYCSEREGPYRAGFHLGYFDNVSSWKDADAWTDKLRTVSAADVQRAAKRYLVSDNRVVGWLAGASAPKAAPPKPDVPAPPAKPNLNKPEHTRLTGYKEDDNATAPSGDAQKKMASSEMLPNAVQRLPNAVGKTPEVIKELPNAVEKVPSVIKSLPSAVGNIPSAIKQIPSTLGGVPSAIRELPGAIGNMPGAAANVVKELPGAIVGIPASAASAIKELPQAIGGVPAATAGALKSVPAALGNFATGLGTIPGAIGKGLVNGVSGQSVEAHLVNTRVARRTLKNGITLVVQQSDLSPVVQVAAAVRAGSVYEPAGKKGLAEVTAAVFNAGTAKRGRTQILTQQEDLGIQPAHMLRFDNDVETLQFTTRCLSRDLGTLLDLIAETITNPALSDADFEKAKQDAINDAQRVEDTNSRKADRALYRSLLAHGSPFLPEDPSELVHSISALSVVDQRKFLNSYVSPNATTIVMVGDIDADRAAQLLEHAFASWTNKGAHQKIAAHVNSRQVLRAAVPTKDKARTTVGFGKLVPVSRNSGEYGNMLLADTVFSRHPLISRLGQKLTADDALSRALAGDPVETDLTELSDSTAWSFAVDVEPNAVPLTVSAFQKELQTLGKDGIRQDELTEARRYLLGAIPVRTMSTLGSSARSLLEGSLHSDSPDPESNLVATIKSANVESVNKMIKHTLKPELATLVVVGSSQSIRATRNQVASQQAAQSSAAESPEQSTQSPPAEASSATPAAVGSDAVH